MNETGINSALSVHKLYQSTHYHRMCDEDVITIIRDSAMTADLPRASTAPRDTRKCIDSPSRERAYDRNSSLLAIRVYVYARTFFTL